MTQGYIGISKINKRTGDLNEWNVMGIVYIKMHGCTCMMHEMHGVSSDDDMVDDAEMMQMNNEDDYND